MDLQKKRIIILGIIIIAFCVEIISHPVENTFIKTQLIQNGVDEDIASMIIRMREPSIQLTKGQVVREPVERYQDNSNAYRIILARFFELQVRAPSMIVVKDFDFIEFYPDTSIEAYDVLVGVLGNDLETLSLAIQLEDCARAHLTT